MLKATFNFTWQVEYKKEEKGFVEIKYFWEVTFLGFDINLSLIDSTFFIYLDTLCSECFNFMTSILAFYLLF